ncbi:hypothetical protein FACS189472_15580 [Alphaproteobacteria bacterium]|nr:hypothetical protein FACS189472_15580 [Alphaproteobacteria bacterium]
MTQMMTPSWKAKKAEKMLADENDVWRTGYTLRTSSEASGLKAVQK